MAFLHVVDCQLVLGLPLWQELTPFWPQLLVGKHPSMADNTGKLVPMWNCWLSHNGHGANNGCLQNMQRQDFHFEKTWLICWSHQRAPKQYSENLNTNTEGICELQHSQKQGWSKQMHWKRPPLMRKQVITDAVTFYMTKDVVPIRTVRKIYCLKTNLHCHSLAVHRMLREVQ